MKRLFYLIGVPGCGKTTLLRRALYGIPYMQCKEGLVSFVKYPKGAELGVLREGGFSGTDGLAMNVMPEAISWLHSCPTENLIAEGDRLASGKFFRAAKAAGFELTVALLDCPLDEVNMRLKKRGSKQDANWLKGRLTKVGNLVAEWVDPLWILNGEFPVDINVQSLWGHPVFQEIVPASVRGVISK